MRSSNHADVVIDSEVGGVPNRVRREVRSTERKCTGGLAHHGHKLGDVAIGINADIPGAKELPAGSYGPNTVERRPERVHRSSVE